MPQRTAKSVPVVTPADSSRVQRRLSRTALLRNHRPPAASCSETGALRAGSQPAHSVRLWETAFGGAAASQSRQWKSQVQPITWIPLPDGRVVGAYTDGGTSWKSVFGGY